MKAKKKVMLKRVDMVNKQKPTKQNKQNKTKQKTSKKEK